MKLKKVTSLVALFMAVSFSAVAQTSTKMNVKVPFNFVAGDQYLPAGQYRIVPVFTNSQTAWRIVSDDGKSIASMNTDSTSSPVAGHRRGVAFERVGARYVLTTIWLDNHSGREIPGATVDTLEAKSPSNTVEVAAN